MKRKNSKPKTEIVDGVNGNVEILVVVGET
jgi:hypothetical protein